MSRSGYSDEDYDETFPNASWLYGANVKRAMRGKRGQKFLRELIAALEKMPDKRLIEGALRTEDGMMCALGAVARERGLEVSGIDPENANQVGKAFKITPMVAREIVSVNDDDFSWQEETPEHRYTRVLAWARGQIIT